MKYKPLAIMAVMPVLVAVLAHRSEPSDCPEGTIEKTICVATPVPSPTSTLTPLPTTTALRFEGFHGGWLNMRCAKRVNPTPDSQGKREYFYTESFYGVGPSLALESIELLQEPCAAETWLYIIGGHEKVNGEVDQAMLQYRAKLRSLKAWADARKDKPPCTADNLRDCYPGPLKAFIVESSPFVWGMKQDLAGGFYKTVNGKKVLKDPKELLPALPAVTPYILQEFKKEGVEEFLIAPYVFGFSNRWFETTWWGELKASSRPVGDGRREWPRLPEHGGNKLGATPEQAREKALARIAKLNKVNPKIWPLTYDWSAKKLVSRESPFDAPTKEAAERDLFYYTMFVRAVREQYPEITRIVPQLSNCVYGLQPGDPWLDKMASALPAVNAFLGFPPDIQIEGCNTTTNLREGRPWDAPYVDCPAYNAIRKYKNPQISMWPSPTLHKIGNDFRHCSAGTGFHAASPQVFDDSWRYVPDLRTEMMVHE